MLKNISKLGSVLNRNQQKEISGGRADSKCDYTFHFCHNHYDSDEDYMFCMRTLGCGLQA